MRIHSSRSATSLVQMSARSRGINDPQIKQSRPNRDGRAGRVREKSHFHPGDRGALLTPTVRSNRRYSRKPGGREEGGSVSLEFTRSVTSDATRCQQQPPPPPSPPPAPPRSRLQLYSAEKLCKHNDAPLGADRIITVNLNHGKETSELNWLQPVKFCVSSRRLRHARKPLHAG